MTETQLNQVSNKAKISRTTLIKYKLIYNRKKNNLRLFIQNFYFKK